MTDGPTHRVLVAEDDPEIRRALERILAYDGYSVLLAADGTEALVAVRDERPDLVLLDVMMPHLDGLEVCRRMRADGDRTPVLMLTARQEVPDRVAGLDAGADDYLPKPFDLTELLARVRALLRRSSPGDSVVLRVGELQLDPARRVVTVGGRPVDLTRTEFAVLKMLLENPDVVLERSRFYQEIWGYDFEPGSRSLDVHVGYLRRKLEATGLGRMIETVRGVGFVIRPAGA